MSDTTSKASNLHTAITAVMLEAGTVAMTGKNKEQGYAYASDADLLRALQPAMAKAGLTLVLEAFTHTDAEAGKTRGGASVLRTDVIAMYRLTHAPTGGHLFVPAFGRGLDSQDKGGYKAMTGALKYVLRQLFLIPTGDDPERDQPAERVDPPARRDPPRRDDPPADPASPSPSAAPAPSSPEEVTADGDASHTGRLRRYWFARLKDLGFNLTNAERHDVQYALFKFASLKELGEELAQKALGKLKATPDERLKQLITASIIPY
jgi:hypothetical protein